jgi:hypothetical protein
MERAELRLIERAQLRRCLLSPHRERELIERAEVRLCLLSPHSWSSREVRRELIQSGRLWRDVIQLMERRHTERSGAYGEVSRDMRTEIPGERPYEQRCRGDVSRLAPLTPSCFFFRTRIFQKRTRTCQKRSKIRRKGREKEVVYCCRPFCCRMSYLFEEAEAVGDRFERGNEVLLRLLSTHTALIDP